MRLLLTCAMVFLFLPTSSLFAADENVPAASSGLQVVDWVIVGIYALGTVFLGYYFSRRQNSTEEYFVGCGSMNPILIGVSLFATLLSTISYLSMPGESVGKGPVFMVSLIALPFTFGVVGFVLLPIYKEFRVTSAYELLEKKLGVSIRLLGATMFLILRLVWMSVMMYMTSLALTNMLGLADSYVPIIAFVVGAIAVTYTSLGGLRAVVITDAMQTILLYGGAVTVIGVISWRMGGFGWFPTEWNPNWDQQPIFPTDLSTRVSGFGVVLMTFIWGVCTYGGDQTSIQRFMAVKDVKAAQKALAMQVAVSALVSLTLGLVGLSLLGYFTAHPEALPAHLDLKQNADKMFPYFVANQLPPVVSGFVVAAMLAAAMSSIDSGVNSITAVVMTDYLDRFNRSPKDDKQHVFMSRLLACGIGLFVVTLSSQMGALSGTGNFTAITKKFAELLTTPIFALFIFALFVPFANTRGVWLGAICGTATAATVAFSGAIVFALHHYFQFDPADFGSQLTTATNPITKEVYQTCTDPISFQWIHIFALIVNLCVGTIASLLFQSKNDTAPAGEPVQD